MNVAVMVAPRTARELEALTGELLAAVCACSLGGEGLCIGRAERERLARACDALPDEGLSRAWYALVDGARAWLELHAGAAMAPRFHAKHLVLAATDFPPQPVQPWQDRER